MIIEVDGGMERLQTGLQLGSGALQDWSTFWGAVSIIWARTRAQVFETRGASVNRQWPTYSQTGERQYAAIKSSIFRRRVGAQDLLRWQPGRERLFPSLTDESHPEYVDERSPESITLGTRVPYASNHNRGQGRAPEHLGGHTIPRRPFMAIGRPMTRQIATALGNYAGRIGDIIDGEQTARVGLTTSDVTRIMRGVR